jgi:hypothetical protein
MPRDDKRKFVRKGITVKEEIADHFSSTYRGDTLLISRIKTLLSLI